MALGEADEGSLAKKVRDALKQVREAAAVLEADPSGFDKQVQSTARDLREATGEFGDIELHISTNRITCGDQVVYKSDARDNNLAFDLFRQGLRRLTFKPGVSDDEVRSFMVLFAECRSADQIDSDFVSTLWQESLPNIQYVAIDGFTEKIFMSEQRFVAAFRSVIDDIVPGLVGMAEEDEGDRQPRPRDELDAADVVVQCETRELANRKALETGGDAARALINGAGEELPTFDHLIRLLGCLAVKHPSPLGDEELCDYVLEVLVAYLDRQAWQPFADAVRTLRQLCEAGDRFEAPVAARLRTLFAALGGSRLASALAARLDPEQTDFTAWIRWHFVTAAALTAPEILQAVNTCEHAPGKDFLKELLRRQGTEALDPWAERLKDPNPGVVLEVLDVILGSDLGEQARPLLMETLRHEDGSVRARAVEGLFGAYDLKVREALLPHLKDPDTKVRRAVVTQFAAAGDRSVCPYLASTIRSDIFVQFDEDEQRLYFESLARLGGERFVDVFREHLGLDEGGGSAGGLGKLFKRGRDVIHDDPMRRAAISGLGVLGGQKALALVRQVHAKADLELASHCDVVLRLAVRGEARGEAPIAVAPRKAPPLEDVGVGRARMGAKVLFEPDAVRVTPPPRQRPAGAPVAAAAVAAGGAVPSPAAAPVTQAPPVPRTDLPIGERPLLDADEVFLPDDRRRLKAEPAVSEGPRFRLTSPRATLVGVPGAVAPPARVVEPARAVVPARIIERSATPAVVADWSHQPDASLEDILMSYLGEEAAAPRAPTPPPRAPTPPPAPARAPTPPPIPVAAAVEEAPVVLDELLAPPDPEEPLVTAPAAAEPPPADRPKGSVDDLLKDFLSLDLGD